MAIHVNEKDQIFSISTKNTTYMMGVCAGEHLLHLYYGKRMEDLNAKYLIQFGDSEPALHWMHVDAEWFNQMAPFEYSAAGTGDFRDVCLQVRDVRGYRVCQLKYDSYRIFDGKPGLPGLPATFGDNAQTLEIKLRDEALQLTVLLRYSVFEDSDALIKSVELRNEGSEKLYLEKALSGSLSMPNENYEVSTLHGTWARERHIVKRPVTEGKFSVASVCGKSSHVQHPFMMLTSPGATQTYGEAFGMNFIYSGNFLAETELNYQNSIRMTMGIHPDGFEWVLEPGASFVTPELVTVYSSEGIGNMTRTFHDLYRNHLIRSPWLHKKRPILVNNWEATYFNFDQEKLYAIAEEASKLGVEMLVMDDGWFGKRYSETTSLGDWVVNEKKLPDGLKALVDRINALGMKFGIWFEPEMISPDSDLYRTHPEWAVQTTVRTPTLCRTQYVLDMTREDVREYLFQNMVKILRSANIEYVKWDMNRCITDAGSAMLDAEHMGEFFHRYVLGLYELQERLLQEFPNLLLENCTGGGGRFDAGMLYYSPQIWCSDNMDPKERLFIQEGTALIYPLGSMGAHVCVCPNHSVGRVSPFHTRANVAMSGTFGYELDITKLSEEEKQQVVQYNALYHRYNDISREGDYYRIASCRENGKYDCWMTVSKDKKEFLLTFVQIHFDVLENPFRLRLQGLDPSKQYRLEGTDKVYSGQMLMHAGYRQGPINGDYGSVLLHFVEENI